MKLSEVYEAAADTIEKYGHNRSDLGSTKEGMCALGAINFATCGDPQKITFWGQHPIATQAFCKLELKVGDSWGGFVVGWSDFSPTQEVLDTLRKLAKEARLEEEGIQ